jgi:Glycosyl hydrolase family 79 C-terminal beta domain
MTLRLTRALRRRLAGAALALAAGVVAAGCAHSAPGAAAAHAPDGPRTIDVGSAAVGQPIPSGFVGLSMEYHSLETYAGSDPDALDPPFVQLLRDLSPGSGFILRIGGDSSDWTWWPVAHVRRPPGIRFDLDANWLEVARALAHAVGGRLILGLNLEADDRTVARIEAEKLVSGIGSASIEGLEIGNEPELYSGYNYYRTALGLGVKGRPRGYTFADYLREFSSFAAAMPPVRIAGPGSGAENYLSLLGSFLDTERRVGLVTVHAYALKHCSASAHRTTGELLADQSSDGLAASLAPELQAARSHHVPLRVDEMNGVTCGGQAGVSNVFASSLWSLDTLFAMARAGVAGINVHTVPGHVNEVIGASHVDGKWQVVVHPEYYGLMLFAQAAPAGSRLLRITGKGTSALTAWATRAPDGHVRVVLINRGSGARTAVVRIPSASGPATLERLQAPSLASTTGVTLGGQSFGASTSTGLLAGTSTDTEVQRGGSGAYTVSVPGDSAALLTR